MRPSGQHQALRQPAFVEALIAVLHDENDRRGGSRQVTRVRPAGRQLVAGLGLQPTPHPMGFGEFIAADATRMTSVQGVWVAGNISELSAGAAVSAASGVTAASAIKADLVAVDTRRVAA